MTIPDRLYKFRTFNSHLFATLEKAEIYFAEPSDFNDPFDTDSFLELRPEFYSNPSTYLEPVFKQIEVDDPELAHDFREGVAREFANNNIEGIEDFILRELRGNDGTKNEHAIGILCLSKTFSNLAQWAYYGDNHAGLCLEFDVTGTLFKMKDEVVYKDEMVLFKPEDMFNNKNLIDSLLRKATCWKQEEEVRCFALEGPGVQKFDKQALTKVIFGCKAEDKNIERVKSILREKEYGAGTFIADRMLQSYGMKLRPI